MVFLSARLGFDESKISFALRTAVTSCIALLIAWLAGFDHPQWAAMSVWAASQPLREQAMVKAGFRMIGTIVGTLVGVTLVVLQGFSPWVLVLGLAAWVSLCTWASNIQRGFLAYATVLAGYTAAMVALLDPGIDSDVFALGADRLATVLTGVIMATLAGLLFAPRGQPGSGLRAEVRALVSDILADLAKAVDRQAPMGAAAGFVSRIAKVEDGLELRFPTKARTARSTRAVLIAAVAVVLQRQNRPDAAPDMAAAIHIAAEALTAGDLPRTCAALRQGAAAMGAQRPGLREALENLADAIAAWDPEAIHARNATRVTLDKDWLAAREAGLRAALALLLVGGGWLLTGFDAGNYMLLGVSIMISLFSSFENPGRMMRSVVVGQLCGFAAVFACRWLVWPMLDSQGAMILAMLPFILVGSLLVAHRSTGLIALDYSMVFLLLMQPDFPLVGTPVDTAVQSLGVLFGPIMAMVLYRLVFPTDLLHRIDLLRAMMRRDLADLAGAQDAWDNRTTWRARLYHRSLRLIRLLERASLPRDEAVDQSILALQSGHRIMQLHRLLAEGTLPPRAVREAKLALLRARRFDSQPDKARASLARWFARHRPPQG